MENIRSVFVQLLGAMSTKDVLMASNKIETMCDEIDGVRYLFEILLNDSCSKICQLACITLKRYITGSMWISLRDPERQQIKQGLLRKIVAVDSKVIIHPLMQMSVLLIGFENDVMWYRQLLAEIWKKLYNNNEEENTHGSFILARVAEYMCYELIQLAGTDLFEYFDRALTFASTNKVYNSLCLLNVYDAMASIASFTDLVEIPQALAFFNQKLPAILTVLFNLRQDSEDFSTACDILYGLVDEESKVDAHVQILVDFCLSIVMDTTLCDDVRDKVFDILECLVDYKTKFINLEQITEAVFSIMAQDSNVNSEWDYHHKNGDGPNIYDDAMRILLSVTIAMDPNMMIKMFLQIFTRAKQNKTFSSFGLLRAYFCFLATMTGDCRYVVSENLDTFMNMVLHGLNPKNSALRNPALNALRSFTLVPNMRKYVSISIRVLMQLMNQLTIDYQKTLKSSPLINIVDTLNAVLQIPKEQELLDLLMIMNQLMSTLSVSRSVDLTGSILVGICHVIQSAKESMNPLIPQLLQIVQGFTWKLNENGKVIGNDDSLNIGTHAVELIGSLMRYCSSESYAPFIGGTLSYAQQLMNDAVLMKTCNVAVINLVDCCSFIAKNDVAPLMPQVVSLMMQVLEPPSEAIEPDSDMAKLKDFCGTGPSDEDMPFDADDNDQIIDDETETVLVAMKDLVKNSPTAILPYFEGFKAAIVSLTKTSRGKGCTMILCMEISLNLLFALRFNKQNDHLKTTLPRFVKIWCFNIQYNANHYIVDAALEILIKALDSFRTKVLYTDYIKKLLNCVVLNVLKHSTITQKNEEPSGGDDYNILEETAMKKIYRLGLELLTAIGQTFDANEFRQVFETCFPTLLKFFEAAKNDKRLVKQLGDTLAAMNDYIKILTRLTPNESTALLPILYDGMISPCCLVRENSVRCLGTLLLQSESGSPQLYEQILSKLHSYDTSFGRNDGYGALCSCLVKISLRSPSSIPAESTLNLVLMNLPLMGFEDDHEYIFKYFSAILPTMTSTESYFEPIVLKTLAILLKKRLLNNNSLEAGKNLFKCLYSLNQVRFDQIVTGKPQVIEAIRALMN